MIPSTNRVRAVAPIIRHHQLRRSKIVATIGPASNKPEVLEEMIEAGLDVARLNFSHGTKDDHRVAYEAIRHLSKKVGRTVAILQDLQGPKIRVGKFKKGAIELVVGKKFTITTQKCDGTKERVSTTYAGLADDVNVGDVLLLDDGLLALRALEVTETDVVTEVEIGGTLKNNKGINLPNVAVSAPSVTKRDKDHAEFGLELGVDYVALSFVRSSLDVHMLRAFLSERGGRQPHIIAKIEKPQAIDELDNIIAVTDGIMIARGDLGVELPPEQVPMIQKRAIISANHSGCLTITATQMLESMTQNSRPTRAEASDVANAILDGSDAVMLSGETASGKYPVEAIKMMDRIIREVEDSTQYQSLTEATPFIGNLKTFPNAVAKSACMAADELNVNAIVCFTNSGATAKLLMTYRPSRPIVACTPDQDVVQRMALYWGVVPYRVPPQETMNELISVVETMAADKGIGKPGDEIIMIVGAPIGEGTETNLIKFHRLPAPAGQTDFPSSKW